MDATDALSNSLETIIIDSNSFLSFAKDFEE